MGLRPALALLGAAVLACTSAPVTSAPPAPAAQPKSAQPDREDEDTFKTKVLPFLQKYCVECHSGNTPKGGLTLEGYTSEAHARKDRKNWLAVQHIIAAGEMPPPKSKHPKPTKDEKEFFIGLIENVLTKVDCSPDTPRDPGRVTIRRLNRAEYNNTIRDLCGVDFKPAEEFPADDVGYGFDNIGDVLSFQPVLLEKYMAAADKILATALNIPDPPKPDQPGLRHPERPRSAAQTPRIARPTRSSSSRTAPRSWRSSISLRPSTRSASRDGARRSETSSPRWSFAWTERT